MTFARTCRPANPHLFRRSCRSRSVGHTNRDASACAAQTPTSAPTPLLEPLADSSANISVVHERYMDDTETDVDCGGECPGCAVGSSSCRHGLLRRRNLHGQCLRLFADVFANTSVFLANVDSMSTCHRLRRHFFHRLYHQLSSHPSCRRPRQHLCRQPPATPTTMPSQAPTPSPRRPHA